MESRSDKVDKLFLVEEIEKFSVTLNTVPDLFSFRALDDYDIISTPNQIDDNISQFIPLKLRKDISTLSHSNICKQLGIKELPPTCRILLAKFNQRRDKQSMIEREYAVMERINALGIDYYKLYHHNRELKLYVSGSTLYSLGTVLQSLTAY
jgi:hypothetical protein